MFLVRSLRSKPGLPFTTNVMKLQCRWFTSQRSRDLLTPEKYRVVAAVILERKAGSLAIAKDADKSVRSVARKPDTPLYLLVKKPRPERAWQFPQGGVEIQETLLEAAKRELLEECGSGLEIEFVHDSPLGQIRYPFPELHLQKFPDAKGAEVHFMKARFISGEVKVDMDEIVDYAWLTKHEMKEYVESDYYHNVEGRKVNRAPNTVYSIYLLKGLQQLNSPCRFGCYETKDGLRFMSDETFDNMKNGTKAIQLPL
ncbi:NUDIX-domain-containing protein [Basidiobolus meristosporus CBS 931.73]|uniref:NUDIX-domain-containing protein n=1 Tax=Basidiobolus meristosporus CBS 931.73 TaxID=1314790 RepID=A0A1Y1Z770_9FUNG|nr:NUDIX-domain-containing protein [Basidiobolus meristosporus CBS 931.73]|eukprot:ORY06110.1 NUDIX-domain-containing protein [Basidiobolus meristosporus CBS 931.73]